MLECSTLWSPDVYMLIQRYFTLLNSCYILKKHQKSACAVKIEYIYDNPQSLVVSVCVLVLEFIH